MVEFRGADLTGEKAVLHVERSWDSDVDVIIRRVGEVEYYTGSMRKWSVEVLGIFGTDLTASAAVKICYEEEEEVCPTPTVVYLDATEITFDGTTASCRVTIDAGVGQTLARIGSGVEAYDGVGWVDRRDLLDYGVQVQTVTLQWEMQGSQARMCISAANGCGATSDYVCTDGYTMPVTCAANSPNYGTGCALLNHYDADNDGRISTTESQKAIADKVAGIITEAEMNFVGIAWNHGVDGINKV